MTEIMVYLEGGGDTADGRARLRQGMQDFIKELKDRARETACRLRVVPSGGRQQAYDAFIASRQNRPGTISVLLVDSEGPVVGARDQHLTQRDGWQLAGVPVPHVHLMAQTMEAWIVADADALAKYYGQKFKKNALPVRQNLEEESKLDIATKLEQATAQTQKGAYHKMRHGPNLLGQIDPNKVHQRCGHCRDLFVELKNLIG